MPRVGTKGAILRNKIAACALEMFETQGYDGSSTRAIAERLGIKHSTLLYHFGTKINLWNYVMAGVIKQFRTSAARDMPANPLDDPEAALRGVINAMVDFSKFAPQLHKVMMMENAQNNGRLPWLVENQLQPHFQLVIELIETLQKKGRVWPVDPLRLHYCIIGTCGMLASSATEIEFLTGKNVFKDGELEQTKAFLTKLVFKDAPDPGARAKRTKA